MAPQSATSNDLDQKERQILVQEGELQLKREQFAYEKQKGPLANVAVAVTTIGGAAAIFFQALGVIAAHEEKITAQAKLAISDKQADKEWDLKGLELFVGGEEKLIGCDPVSTETQISLFSSLFPDLMPRFRAAASSKALSCATARSNVVAATVGPNTAAPEAQAIAAAADDARYATMSSFAASVATPSTTASDPLKTVYIQIADESQRQDALALQQALIAKGYSSPGIELVKSAPNAPQLRIYRSNEQAAAANLAKFIAATLHTSEPSVQSLEKSFSKLPAGIAEFWFPAAPVASSPSP